MPQFHAHPLQTWWENRQEDLKNHIHWGYYLVISKFALIKGTPPKISRKVKSHWWPVVSFVFLWGTTYQGPQESRSPEWIWELLQSWALPSTSWPSWLFWHPGDGGISHRSRHDLCYWISIGLFMGIFSFNGIFEATKIKSWMIPNFWPWHEKLLCDENQLDLIMI